MACTSQEGLDSLTFEKGLVIDNDNISGNDDFIKLKTSTKTIMVYTNIVFNLKELFYSIPICWVKIPYAKKVKRTDIYAPYGGIFSVQKRTETRGVDTRTTVASKKKKKAQKATSSAVIKKEKNIEHFLNQVSILLSLEDHHIHMMLFSDNIKIAGCRSNKDALLAVSILYENFLKVLSKKDDIPYFTLKAGAIEPIFVFETVMRNVDFSLNFNINREKVNDIFNDVGHEDRVFMSQFETTEQKNVNMKIYGQKKDDFTYLCYKPEDPIKVCYTKQNFHKTKIDQLYNTFLIFSSAKVILSGKHNEDMEKSYNFFIKIMMDHREEIEEKIEPVTEEEKKEFINILYA